MAIQEDRTLHEFNKSQLAERNASITLHFAFISIIWGMMPVWCAIWFTGDDIGKVFGWFGIVAELAFTAVGWHAAIQRGASVWRSGIAIGIIVFGSGGIGQLALIMNWWSAFGLLFVLDVLAWRLVSTSHQ